MKENSEFNLFDYVIHVSTGDALRLVQTDKTSSQPVWWGRDRHGGLVEVGEDLLRTEWRIGHSFKLESSDPARILGCLLAGAAGDALGAAVEFSSWDEIRDRFGPKGIRRFAEAYGRLGAITDDTQMTLFTAEGLLRACVRSEARGICHPPSVIHHSLLRWLVTQGREPATKTGARWLAASATAPMVRTRPRANLLERTDRQQALWRHSYEQQQGVRRSDARRTLCLLYSSV